MIISGHFECFQRFNVETNFLRNTNAFQKTGVTFWLKVLRLKVQHFHIKRLCQKPMLRQKEWGVENGPITKNGVFPVTTLFFRKFCSNIRTLECYLRVLFPCVYH